MKAKCRSEDGERKGKERTHSDVLVCDPALFKASEDDSACRGTQVPWNFPLVMQECFPSVSHLTHRASLGQ